MVRILIPLLMLVVVTGICIACATIGNARGVELAALGIVGHKDPPKGWTPTGRYADGTVVDGFYVLVNRDEPFRTARVARVECPWNVRAHRVAVIDVTTQRVLAHGESWIGNPPRGFIR